MARIVVVAGFISHVEHVWDSPDQAAWFNHGKADAFVMFDKRGIGYRTRPMDGRPWCSEGCKLKWNRGKVAIVQS
jgi:hypothetical protein